jgi:hypothetical protein
LCVTCYQMRFEKLPTIRHHAHHAHRQVLHHHAG